MLPSPLRLKRRSDFGRVYSKGRSYATDLVVVYVLADNQRDTKIGFSVSKKLGGAVARNRVRRLIAEAVRRYVPHIRPGSRIIIVARVRAGGASLTDISAAIRAALSRSGVVDARDL